MPMSTRGISGAMSSSLCPKEDTMAEKKVQLIVCWLCLMLIYLLGDVLRVYEKGQGAGR